MKKNKGFTLIELIVVVGIIGILSSIILSKVSIQRERARDIQRISNVNQIENAIALYRVDNNVPPGESGIEYINGNPEWIPGLVPKYISAVPSDPINKEEYKFHYFRQGGDYEIIALLEQKNNKTATNDGGLSGEYYEKASGKFNEVYDTNTKEWHFSASSNITYLSCPTVGQQVAICHKTQDQDVGQTITVSCNAIGPEGHSNHSSDILGICPTKEINDNDSTRRIMYWWGKVNQHTDANGVWQSDPDGVSGANLDMLTYCKKWYPNTVSFEYYKTEMIDTWRRAIYYEQSGYTATQNSYKCVQVGETPAPSSTPDPTYRIMYWSGKVNQHIDGNGVWQSDPDGVSGANLNMLTYCKKWYPYTIDVQPYKTETISTWKRTIEYEQNNYTGTQTSYRCIQR